MKLTIAKILGLSDKPQDDSWDYWVLQARQGIPKRALMHYLTTLHASLAEAEKVLPISARTLQRYPMGKIFNSHLSGHVVALAKVFSRAVEVFEDQGKARHWLRNPCRALGMVVPFSLLDSPMGIQAVEDELERIENGVYF